MTEEQGIAFLQALRAKNIRVKDNGWIEASCVLAPWTHSTHRDISPSFGLRIAPGERSHFLCFACRQGSAEELLHTLELYVKGSGHQIGAGTYDFAVCHQILADEEFVVSLPEYQEFGAAGPVFIEWPQYWLESFVRADWVTDALLYLETRGVTTWQTKFFDLRWDSKRSMIVAPYRDVYGRLAGARGRSILKEGQQHYDYTYLDVNNARLVWYHEEALNLQGPVVVVEGQFDCWRTVQAYPKTVANLTAKPTLEKMKKLCDSGIVIQIPDRDAAGQESIDRYASLCAKLGLEHRVIWLDEGAKDPDDCAVAYLKDRIDGVLGC